MTLEQQFCSLELAKRFKELGVKQESVFVYIKTKHAKGIYYVTEAIKPLLSMPDTEWYAAFTVAELGEMMPGFTESKTDKPDERFPGFMVINVSDMRHEYDANEANCRAKMLIYLLENKLITL